MYECYHLFILLWEYEVYLCVSDLSLIEKEILQVKKRKLRLTLNAKRDNATSPSDSEQCPSDASSLSASQSQGTKRKFGTELQQETLQLSNDQDLGSL